MNLKVKRLHPDAKVPTRATAGAAGYDLYAIETVEISDMATLVRTGLSIQLPPGYEAQIRPRSGLAKKGLDICNSPGTIDSDYTGEIGILMSYRPYLSSKGVFIINAGDRVAQMVISKYELFPFELVDELDQTTRGAGGFGSTGK